MKKNKMAILMKEASRVKGANRMKGVSKMKKSKMAILLCLALTVSNAVLATGNSDITINTNGTETIPIYGYLGAEADIIDPDPELEIYVEVPVQIMFAAFESNSGKVTSPKFAITNLSAANDIRVEIDDFAQRPYPDVDLDGKLSLRLTDYNGEDIVADLFPAEYNEGKLLAANLSKQIDGFSDNKLEFMLGGTWGGSFSDELKPVFDITIKFSAVE